MSTISYSYFNSLLFNLFSDNTSFISKPKVKASKPETLKETKLESNISDPRVSFFEERVASLENGTNAIATKSVKSARFSIIKNLLEPGDNVVTFNSWSLYHEDKSLYGRLGIEIKISDDGQLDTFRKLIDENTKLIYLETISPKYINIPDYQKITSHARSLGIPVVVDNSASVGGYLVSPIFNRANIVIESLEDYLPTYVKYKTVVIDGGNFAWQNSRITKFASKNVQASEKNRNNANSVDIIELYRKNTTARTDHFLIPKDPFSLATRLEAIPEKAQLKSDNAIKLARYLNSHYLIKNVNYTGLPTNNSHFLALTFLHNGFGNYLSFNLSARQDLVHSFYQELKKEIPLKRNLSYDPSTQTIYLNAPAIEFEELVSYFDKVLNLLKGSLEYYKTFREPFYV